MAQRLANEGYAVLMPNVFYRVAQPPVMDMALRANPELFMKRVHELAEPLTPEAIDRDARGYLDFLTDQHAVKDKKKLGGGRVLYLRRDCDAGSGGVAGSDCGLCVVSWRRVVRG